MLLWIALAVAPGIGRCADRLSLVTEEMAPVNMAGPGEGEVIGIATEVIGKALAESHLSYTVSIDSWDRAYDLALRRRDTCVYSTRRTDERLAHFKWIGPVIRDRWVLFGRIDGPALATLDQARGFSIGGHYDGALSAYLKSQGFTVDESADFHTNMQRVAEHRLDYAVAGLLVGTYAIARDKSLADIVPVLAFQDNDLYLACNRSVPDRMVDKLNAVIARMNADGTTTAIIRRYQ